VQVEGIGWAMRNQRIQNGEREHARTDELAVPIVMVMEGHIDDD
jgi:hypothetical protein